MSSPRIGRRFGASAGTIARPVGRDEVLCGMCNRETHPVEMVQDEDDLWRCLRCVEDRRVTTTRKAT